MKRTRGLGIGDLSAFFMVLLICGVISGVGLYFLSSLRDEFVYVGNESVHEGINTTIDAYTVALGWLGLIALVFSAALLIVILMRAFSGGKAV